MPAENKDKKPSVLPDILIRPETPNEKKARILREQQSEPPIKLDTSIPHTGTRD